MSHSKKIGAVKKLTMLFNSHLSLENKTEKAALNYRRMRLLAAALSLKILDQTYH